MKKEYVLYNPWTTCFSCDGKRCELENATRYSLASEAGSAPKPTTSFMVWELDPNDNDPVLTLATNLEGSPDAPDMFGLVRTGSKYGVVEYGILHDLDGDTITWTYVNAEAAKWTTFEAANSWLQLRGLETSIVFASKI